MFPALACVSRFPKSVIPTGLQLFFFECDLKHRLKPSLLRGELALSHGKCWWWRWLITIMMWYLGGFINQPTGFVFFLAGSWLMMVDFRFLSTNAWCFMKKKTLVDNKQWFMFPSLSIIGFGNWWEQLRTCRTCHRFQSCGSFFESEPCDLAQVEPPGLVVPGEKWQLDS